MLSAEIYFRCQTLNFGSLLSWLCVVTIRLPTQFMQTEIEVAQSLPFDHDSIFKLNATFVVMTLNYYQVNFKS